MDKSQLWRKIGIQAGIIILFIVLSYLYLFPLLEGKVLTQGDIQSHAGMSKELADYRKATGEEAIWTNAMFGGMPGYMISVNYNSNLLNYIQGWFRALFHPAAMIILYLICFYVLLTSLKINRWLSLAGALAYGFSTYLIIIIGAGHNTKAYALGFLMLVVAGVLMAFRRDRLKGGLLFTAGLAFEIMAGHPQITYYGFLALVLFGIIELVYAIREKRIPDFLKTTGILAAGAVLALSVNFSYLYSNYRYSKETIRGKSELTHNSANQTSGLDKDYVVQWSQGISETLTLLIPDFMGGSSVTSPGENSETYKLLKESTGGDARQSIRMIRMYHGEKPFTSGPYYSGAMMIFLFVLGLFVVKGADKWWLLTATMVSVVLSWGKYVMPLTSFLLDYLPLYNKFRATEMTLTIATFSIPLLGFIGLHRILSGLVAKPELIRALKWSFGITAGITLLFSLLPGIAGGFWTNSDTSYFMRLVGNNTDFFNQLKDSVIIDRRQMLQADAFRSFVFIVLAAGAILLWHLKKIRTDLFYAAFALLILADLWFVDKRFLNKENFTSKRDAQNIYVATPVDQKIMNDKDISYRVLYIPNPWQDSRASYFHKNVGGYHAAKLRRYQEMIDYHFAPELERLIAVLEKQEPPHALLGQLTTLNMLNTRYFFYNLNGDTIRNHQAWGNAWFAAEYQVVADADEEIKALEQIKSKNKVVIDRRFSGAVEGKQFISDPSATISLTDYKPNDLKYSFNASSEQLAVFSEVYYKDGWKAYVDGKETPHFRVNYILRAMVVPAGSHTIEFRFHPASYYTGNKVSLAGSILLFLAVAGFIIYEFRRKK